MLFSSFAPLRLKDVTIVMIDALRYRAGEGIGQPFLLDNASPLFSSHLHNNDSLAAPERKIRGRRKRNKSPEKKISRPKKPLAARVFAYVGYLLLSIRHGVVSLHVFFLYCPCFPVCLLISRCHLHDSVFSASCATFYFLVVLYVS